MSGNDVDVDDGDGGGDVDDVDDVDDGGVDVDDND